MKHRLCALFLSLMLLISSAPCAMAADASDILTAGGNIRLTGDLTLSHIVTLTKDTVLDLNGFTITGESNETILVPEGISFSCKKGTLENVQIENRGYIPYLDTLTLTSSDTLSAPVHNFGVIDAIQRCIITAPWNCIGNSSDIHLIYDCDILSTENYSAVENADHQRTSPNDSDGKSIIDIIRHCRIRGGTEGFNGRALSTHGGLVEDSILLGLSPTVHVYGDDLSTFRNCTIIAADKEEGPAVRTVFQEDPAPRLEDCTLIAMDGPCGERELVNNKHVYVEHGELINCTYIKRTKVRNLNPYLEWEMESKLEEPTTPDGLLNFTRTATYTPGQFTDLSDSHWGAPSIAHAYELGLMSGTDSGIQPDAPVSLAQAVTMAARLRSTYYADGESFTSTNGAWYQSFVDYALANSILTTNYDNYDRPAKRHEFAAILAAALPAEALAAVNTVNDNAIPDVSSTHPSAAAIYTFYRAGILTGTDSAGSFAPDLEINRAAAAVILTHMADPALRVIA